MLPGRITVGVRAKPKKPTNTVFGRTMAAGGIFGGGRPLGCYLYPTVAAVIV
jgi:hypothetical protein